MRNVVSVGLVLLASVVFPQALFAQRSTLKITQVQLGFLTPDAAGEFKAGVWTPVYIKLEGGSEGSPRGELIVETADSDDVPNRFRVPFPALDAEKGATVLGYTKPGSGGCEITVTAEIGGRVVATHQDTYPALQPEQQIYLTVGSRLGGLRQALVTAANKNKKDTEKDRDTGTVRLTSIDAVNQLPTHWFAYQSVDWMLLTTGDRDFVTGLDEDKQGRKEAIAEWVRRGGRLVISVGGNQDWIDKLKVIQPMLPVSVRGAQALPRSRAIENYANAQTTPFPKVDIAKLEPRPSRELTQSLREGTDGPLLIARGVYGLGQVVVVAFDLDKEPFTTWSEKAQEKFFERLRIDVAPPLPNALDPIGRFGNMNTRGFNASLADSDLATQLEADLEEFAEVPVISFGWVALFILIYILIVGPLDYLFLKKVVKRLELTWITFPVVVITISVAAYFTAYWLKGNEQRINKVDLVDIDLQTQQVYGTTWFTLFSPGIQNYTVGVEPADPSWAQATGSGSAGSQVVLSWLGRPEAGWGGYQQSRRSQGLFHRAYEFAPEGAGVIGVPIQVWSTKSFIASWQGMFDPRRLVEANLERIEGGDAPRLSGTITSHLPVTLEDVVLYYGRSRDKDWYELGQLPKDSTQRVDNMLTLDKVQIQTWLNTIPQSAAQKFDLQNQASSHPSSGQTITVMKRILFQSATADTRQDNVFRSLDQGWRMQGAKDLVVLYGRIPRQEGSAEEITSNASCPTRLWFGALPAAGSKRPALSGTLTQDTYVRIFIPVPWPPETK
jgi:hypothetical protein